MPDTQPIPSHDDHPDISARNARYGLVLFTVYVLFYGGFMALSAFRPDLMSHTPFGGVNLAILYGLGLIVLALALAIVYMVLCRPTK